MTLVEALEWLAAHDAVVRFYKERDCNFIRMAVDTSDSEIKQIVNVVPVTEAVQYAFPQMVRELAEEFDVADRRAGFKVVG